MTSMKLSFGKAMHHLHTSQGLTAEELDELKAGMTRLAEARASVLPSFAEAAVAFGNVGRLGAQVESYYAYAEAAGYSRQRADDAIRQAQGLAAGSRPPKISTGRGRS